MQTTPQWQVFVRTAIVSGNGNAVHTTTIPTNDRKHAEAIAEQINDMNVEGSYIGSRAIVIGAE